MKVPVDQSNLSSQKEYFEHIQSTNLRGRLYRKFFLYPSLRRLVKGRMMDIGCGDGEFMSKINQSIGVDINPFCIQHIKAKGMEAYHYERYPLHFEEESFETLFCDNVIEHIDDPSNLIEEMYRLLQKNGRLIIGVPTYKGFHRQADHKVFYDESKLETTFNKFGFKKQKIFYMPFKSMWLEKKLAAHCLYAIFTK